MDRHWLMTWTCYGTWLPGNERGFVSKHRDEHGEVVLHNIPGTPCDADIQRVLASAKERMSGPPVSLSESDAGVLIAQYQETARIRGWALHAASVMYNHTHVLVSVEGDPEPDAILETLKSWATRALKKVRPLPPNGTFWTAKGSTRKLNGEAALPGAVIYVVKKQPNPLATWHHPDWLDVLEAYERSLIEAKT